MSTSHIVEVKIKQGDRLIAEYEYYPYTEYDEPWVETEDLANGMTIETTYIDEY